MMFRIKAVFSFLFSFLIFPSGLWAQYLGDIKNVEGKVFEIHEGHKHPLVGVNIYWSGTTQGTTTDNEGNFTIHDTENSNLLVFSYAGYNSDTIKVTNNKYLEIILNEPVGLDEVEVVRKTKSTELSLLDPVKVENIGEAELEKAACCNLSESFETSPSVDVSFTDAITGTKQIQMLGLAGPYTQITRENMPDIRGLSAIYGMEYIPGSWIESIQLNKGTGTVVNGFESIAGQINVEMRKPETADRIYLNLFANEESRMEANLNLSHKLNDKLSTALLLHGRKQPNAKDQNNDGFMDKPIGDQFILLNRWKYKHENGWRSQFGIKGTQVDNVGGQLHFNPDKKASLWGMEMGTKRLESWLKLGKVSLTKPYQSFGLQISGMVHDQESAFGRKVYDATQQSVYVNFIFQSIISDSRHNYKTGLSLQADNFSEKLDSLNFKRKELVPGAFFEYTYSPGEKFDVVAGIRSDYHNIYGLFFTPRLHVRYAPLEKTVFRLSSGRGQRTASILAENIAVLASSREVIIQKENNKNPYGLEPEVAWNVGANITQKFRLDYRDGAISFDLYYTDFQNQVVVDMNNGPQTILFYNLDGKSISTSFQAQVDYELVRRLDIRMAYRWYDVKTQYLSGLKSKPLVSKNRAFVNLAYSTRNHWKFDYTLQWHGTKRIPSTLSNPVEFRLKETSPSFYLMNAQISKEWGERFEIYIGGENLANFKQKNPIIAANDPFGEYFDSSLIWGPIYGRMFYGGIRLKIR